MNLWNRLFPKTPPKEAMTMKRNEECWCGSGKKYKKCHQSADQHYFLKTLGSVKHPG